MEIETPAIIVECVPGDRASDIRSKLNVLANGKRIYSDTIIHLGTNDV